jgi:energy-converting hydrogenase Eha subunit A
MAVAEQGVRAAPGWGRWAALAAAAAVLHLVLVQPNHPAAMTWSALAVFPLELPVLLLGLAALPRRGAATTAIRAILVAVLVAIAVLKIADFAMFTAFNRGFDPLIDLSLIDAGWRLGAGTLGTLPAALAVGAALLGLAATAAALWWATGRWAGLAPPILPRRVALAGAALATALAVAEIGQAMRIWQLPFAPPGAAFTARVGVERVARIQRTLADLAEFRAAAASDPLAGRSGLLDLLAGHEVIVVFVESYGRASFDNSLYAPTHGATLRAAEARLDAAGVGVRTGWLTSPVEGGQSWLAHATFASGLSVDGATRNAALLASDRLTLWEIARDAGWSTAAVMPAITLPWPEAGRLGFDHLLDQPGLRYRGPAFNWVTMPDQYTLARFRDLLPAGPRPLFAQVALISSHAPWVPVPRPVPWPAVGDGSVFAPMVEGAERPEAVWRDRDRVRDQYRQALDYALGVTLDWAARQAEENGPEEAPLIFILGDHPAAAFVSQVGSRDVPLHVIGPPALLAAIETWGFSPGLTPGAATPVWPMTAFRDRFVDDFTGDAGGGS